jgi:hypothetical protein
VTLALLTIALVALFLVISVDVIWVAPIAALAGAAMLVALELTQRRPRKSAIYYDVRDLTMHDVFDLADATATLRYLEKIPDIEGQIGLFEGWASAYGLERRSATREPEET